MAPKSNNPSFGPSARGVLVAVALGGVLGLVLTVIHARTLRSNETAQETGGPAQVAAIALDPGSQGIDIGSGSDLRILAEEPASAPSSDSGAPDSNEVDEARPVMSDDGVLVLAWEDLMPPGEQEIIDQQYLSYFSELERQARASFGMGRSLLDYSRQRDMGLFGGIEEGSSFDQMVQFGTFNTIPELDGKRVRIPGYIVPFDYRSDDKYEAFLLAPYFGACIHSPPPPPNQIVYVTSDEPVTISSMYPAFWVEGVLSTERNDNDLGDSAYTLRLSRIELYRE